MILRRKYIGAKACHRSYEFTSLGEVSGRGAFCPHRSLTAKTGGVDRSENAGMSSDIHVRNMSTENLRFPRVKLIFSGLVGPKTRPKGVVDGHPVNIPEPVMDVTSL